MKTKLLFTFLSVISFSIINAQDTSANYQIQKKNFSGAPAFIKFLPPSIVNHENFMVEMKDEFNFQIDDNLELIKTTNDKIGFTHFKYSQKYKGIAVFGAQYIIHEKNGKATSANGNFISNLNLDVTPVISKDDAIKSAMKSIGLPKYRWEDKKAEEALKKKTKNNNSTYYPKPELVIAPTGGDYKSGKICLCWKFDVAGITLYEAWTVFVDATNGEVINRISLVTNDFPGIGQTYYNGNQNIKCIYDSPSGYYLLAENQRGSFANQQIYTLDANQDTLPTAWSTSQYIGSLTTTFTSDPVANNIHWGIEQSYDFYALLGRQSFDDNGTYILNLAHYGVNMNNAFWNGYDTVMCYGDGDGVYMDYVVGLDVEGHEFSHAITQYSADLQYQGESGALNESFSDILGTGIEWYVLGASSNWTIGENVMLQSPYFLRSMSNPSLGSQPDTYFGTNWNPLTPVTEANDWGGVHTNSGVQNYWFYLLANGGTGINDNGDNFSVVGIGMSDALNIVYRNLTTYLTNTSGYIDARNGSIQSATDFWGSNSQQVQSVINAWCAVGVGTCSPLAVSNSANTTSISVFPNPTAGIISISSNSNVNDFEIKVVNVLGEEIYKTKMLSNTTELDLSKQPNGVYFVQIISKENSITKRIIINK